MMSVASDRVQRTAMALDRVMNAVAALTTADESNVHMARGIALGIDAILRDERPLGCSFLPSLELADAMLDYARSRKHIVE